ncbi:hypothetical protein [Marinomonas sp. 2405UD68-3]|uniref:hypothetical protein n=1 Tax=Marinomonas sp. 2405UD68-3 TaxID=3391835 RepID=UPI0039C9897F
MNLFTPKLTMVEDPMPAINDSLASYINPYNSPMGVKLYSQRYWFWVTLKTPCSGVVWLYYITKAHSEFHVDNMFTVNVLAGEVILSFLIDGPEFTGAIRIDLGSDMGLYLVRQLHVYPFFVT